MREGRGKAQGAMRKRAGPAAVGWRPGVGEARRGAGTAAAASYPGLGPRAAPPGCSEGSGRGRGRGRC